MLAIDKDGRVAVVTLRRAAVSDAHPRSVREALHDAVADLVADDEVSVILLTGSEEGFTEGLDVSMLGAAPLAEHTEVQRNPAHAIRAAHKPVIAAITGAAIGGGFEIVLACDVVVASTNARFADTHAKVGVDPHPAFTRRLAQLIGFHRAHELALTGAFLEAEQAYEWNLVGRLTAPEALAATALSIARDMAALPLDTLVRRKALLRQHFDETQPAQVAIVATNRPAALS